MNLTALIAYVRDLTGVYSTDLVSDTLVTRWINEAYHEVERKSTWPWSPNSSPVADLTTGTDTPAFDAEFRAILAYRASVKVLGFISDDTNRAQAYQAEFQSILDDMVRFYLLGKAPGTKSTAGNLVRLVRDLCVMYDTDTVSDALVLSWINDAYFELGTRYKWSWVPTTMEVGDSPAFDARFTTILAYRASVRVLTVVNDQSPKKDLYSSEYQNLLSEMVKFYFPKLSTGAVSTASQIGLFARDLTNVYDNLVSDDTLLSLVNDAYFELGAKYKWSWTPTTMASGGSPTFDVRFCRILSYRAAQRILEIVGDPNNKTSIFISEYQSILSDMVKFYFPKASTGDVSLASDIILFARDLTGVYDESVSNSTLLSLVNDAYKELDAKYQWPWTASTLTLSDAPAFDARFRRILSYRVAQRVLEIVGDPNNKTAIFVSEYQSILTDMAGFYLAGLATGTYSTAGNLVKMVRDICSVYDDGLVSDALILSWINSAYLELAGKFNWPWSGSVAVLLSGDQPAFDSKFRPVLAYRAAEKVLSVVNDQTGRAQMFAAEYKLIVDDMYRAYFTATSTGATANFGNLVRLVRDLTGIYDNSISDNSILLHLGRSVSELAQRHDWNWFEGSSTQTNLSYLNGKYSLPFAENVTEIREIWATYNDGQKRNIERVQFIDSIEETDRGIYYDVNSQAGMVYVRPEQSDLESITFKFKLSILDLYTPTSLDTFPFQERFSPCLAYRAAASILSTLNPKDPRISSYLNEYEAVYYAMYSFYQQDHDTRTIQLGGRGDDIYRYQPWFKPA